MKIDIDKNAETVDTGLKSARIKWQIVEDFVRNNPEAISSGRDDVRIWEGTTPSPNIRFEMFAVRDSMYCLNAYHIITWGKDDEFMLDMNDYTYVDSLQDGYRIAEEIYNSIKNQ